MIHQLYNPEARHVTLHRQDLRSMIKLVRTLYSLSQQAQYFQHIKTDLPEIAWFHPGHDSVLMGYDFHLSDTGPKLIEVNNNAGGLWLAWQAHFLESKGFSGKLADQLLDMFQQEFALWNKHNNRVLKNLVILDEDPQNQFLYPEMQAFANLLQRHGINTFIVDPNELSRLDSGVYYQNQRIDLVYNRHCDFYLETSDLADIREAWLNQQICLSPNPHTYALLADKRRMIDWRQAEHPCLSELTHLQRQFLQQIIPDIRLLATENRTSLWQQRKQWVFKPVTAYASKGVYLGKKLTTGKFAELDPEHTLVQKYIEPSSLVTQTGQQFKVDFRLFTYQSHILSIAARIYQGQVTNLRSEGGGFACVSLA